MWVVFTFQRVPLYYQDVSGGLPLGSMNFSGGTPNLGTLKGLSRGVSVKIWSNSIKKHGNDRLLLDPSRQKIDFYYKVFLIEIYRDGASLHILHNKKLAILDLWFFQRRIFFLFWFSYFWCKFINFNEACQKYLIFHFLSYNSFYFPFTLQMSA